MALMSKNGFGSKENIADAVNAGTLDEYDILYLTNGEIGWLDKNKNTVINTPRTQADITASCVDSFDETDGNVVTSGKTIDDIVALLTQKIIPQVKTDAIQVAESYTDKAVAGASGGAAGTEVVEF